MLVTVETAGQGAASGLVRVGTAVGSAVVRWCGEPGEAEGERHIEWSVDEDLTWGGNTVPAGTAAPGVGEDGERVLLRGRLGLDGAGTAVLEVAGALVLLDLGEPAPPAAADGTWVEVRAAREGVGVWPYRL